MSSISISPGRRKPNAPIISATVTSTGTDPAGWRRWWRIESARSGSDWRSLINLHFEICNRLQAISSSWV
jgi:hypothetical protein